MNDQMNVDFDSLKLDIDDILYEVRIMRSEKRFLQIMREDVKKIKEWEKSLIKRMNEPFNALVIGDFKRGKSTLINALLQNIILPTNVLPETVTVNKLIYGEKPSCFIILKNGKKVEIDIQDLKRNRFEKIHTLVVEEIDCVEITSNNELLKELSIVDTPGIGDVFNTFDEQVSDYLKNADALIYVVSAKFPLSYSEQNFISAAIKPMSFARMFVVINMADCLETIEDIDKIEKFTKERIGYIIPDASVFALSALDEICRVKNLKRPANQLSGYLENKFDFFKTALHTDIILQKQVIKTMRIISLAEFMLDDIERRIQLLIHLLNIKMIDMRELQEQYQNENSAFMNTVKKEIRTFAIDLDQMYFEANKWMSEFLGRLKAEIISIKSTASADELQKYFQFYMMDKIKTAIMKCVDVHQRVIHEKLHQAAKNISLEYSIFLHDIDSKIAENILDISWTNVDTAMFATNMVLNNIRGLNLGPILLITQAVAGFLRQKESDKKHQEFLEPMLENYDEIVDEILITIQDLYRKIKESALAKLQSIFDEQKEQLTLSLKQATEIGAEQSNDESIAYLNETKEKIQELKAILHKYK